MSELNSDSFKCESCNADVEKSSEFCPECGSLFISANCENHQSDEAEGVCLICSLPYCSRCGGVVDKRFLCDHHCEYEIRQGMAGVYSNDSITQVEYVKSILLEEGFHPFLILQNENIWPGFNLPHQKKVHTAQHYIMLPFHEVIRAEQLIEKMDL